MRWNNPIEHLNVGNEAESWSGLERFLATPGTSDAFQSTGPWLGKKCRTEHSLFVGRYAQLQKLICIYVAFLNRVFSMGKTGHMKRIISSRVIIMKPDILSDSPNGNSWSMKTITRFLTQHVVVLSIKHNVLSSTEIKTSPWTKNRF